jgi:hypothetical protein
MDDAAHGRLLRLVGLGLRARGAVVASSEFVKE